MLCLTHKKDDEITLLAGEHEIRLTIARVHNGRVRINYDAPKSVKIIRSELGEHDPEKDPTAD